MDTSALLLIVLALAIGAVLGWFVASRPLADLRARLEEAEGAADKREDEFRTAIKELGDARIEVATLRANAENFDKQIAAMNQAREELLTQFKATGAEVLGRAQEEFLKRAEERLGHSEKASEEKLKALLAPVGDRLKSYEEQVKSLEEKRVDAFGQLAGVIEQMRQGQEAVRREAQRLGNSLTNAPKARGRWGERALQNLLEQCGLAEHTDFMMEHSIATEEGRLRPDAIVRIPGGKMLVIDSKVSLNAYQEAFEADNEETRARAMGEHVRSMRSHVQTLGAKSYQSQFEDAPDYVVMFVPGEHFVAAALEHDPELWNFAFEKRVLLATPTNLVAIARTVAQVWRQDQLANEAKEIGRLGAELFDRLAKVTEEFGKLGTHLTRAVNSYNDFNRSFESRVLVTARKMKEKGVEIGKREIDEVPLVEAAPRYTAADLLEDGSAEGAG